MSDSKEVPSDVDGASCPSRCSMSPNEEALRSCDPSNLAFENFSDDNPSFLWRVVWWRVWGKNNERRLRCSDYFASEEMAWEFAGKRIEVGHEIIRVDKFELKPAS